MSKRLTDAECSAESWKATALLGRAVIDWLASEMDQRIIEASTWHRFATLPHAHDSH